MSIDPILAQTKVVDYTKTTSQGNRSVYMMKKWIFWFCFSAISLNIYADDSYLDIDDSLSFSGRNCDSVFECSQLAERGDKRAKVTLGIMYLEGRFGAEKNHKLGLKWIEEMAESSYPLAQAIMGLLYLKGDAVKKDEKKAYDWLLKSAMKGFAMAQNAVGVMYREGIGVDQNDKLAVYWFKQGSARHDPEAMHNLGRMYMDGRGVDKNQTKAKAWTTRAIEKYREKKNKLLEAQQNDNDLKEE